MSETEPRKEEGPDEDARPLIGEPVGPAPMRLRAEPPRVTRLSRKVLAGLGLVASVGLGGALVYAAEPLAKGSRLRLALCDREARVVWSNGKRFGISFDRPIPLDQVQSIVADHDALIHVASKRLPPLAA